MGAYAELPPRLPTFIYSVGHCCDRRSYTVLLFPVPSEEISYEERPIIQAQLVVKTL